MNPRELSPEVTAEAKSPPATKPPKARVSDRTANVDGAVIVAEYHHVRDGKGDMFRTKEQFRKDLERLYAMGFRPVTVTEYLSNKMDLPPGASPVVMTFDDSNPSQFQVNEDGTVDRDCAIGIWQEFAKTHEDFPVRATFYVLPEVMWAQKKDVAKKVEMLHSWGSELASHTVTHPKLSKLSDEQVKKELADAADALVKFGEKNPITIALPFGISPKNKALLKGFSYGGKTYKFDAAFLVGANPAPAPTSEKLNRYRIPRIQACEGDAGLTYWLDLVKKGQVKLYVAP